MSKFIFAFSLQNTNSSGLRIPFPLRSKYSRYIVFRVSSVTQNISQIRHNRFNAANLSGISFLPNKTNGRSASRGVLMSLLSEGSFKRYIPHDSAIKVSKIGRYSQGTSSTSFDHSAQRIRYLNISFLSSVSSLFSTISAFWGSFIIRNWRKLCSNAFSSPMFWLSRYTPQSLIPDKHTAISCLSLNLSHKSLRIFSLPFVLL